jgi:glycosyltransferase involved in cell wall biosynthesis
MHVLFDARMLGSKKFGIARYAENLLKQFQVLGRQDRFTLLISGEFPLGSLRSATNIKLVRTGIKWLSFLEQLWLPLLIKRIQPDICFFPSFAAPMIQPAPTVIVIHDLMHLVFARDYSLRHKLYYNVVLRSALKKAKKVIAISRSSKKDIMRYYGLPDDKVEVIYNGVENVFRPVSDRQQIERFKKQKGLPERFLLFVGSSKVSKNLENIIAAFGIFSRTDKEGRYLVLSGTQDAKLGGEHEKIICAGDIDEVDLPLLYNSAELFVSPSLYEGFGLPHLEAMACGVPVIASNVSSLPEVVGDAGIQVDPRKPEEIAAAMSRVLGDKGFREGLVKKGLERARKFSWETSASKTLAVCRSALQQN